jgi:prephenate dehydrogenase
MKITIIGDGAFGSFLKELLADTFDIVEDSHSVVLAVPISAYADCAIKYKDKHLINVCSVQQPSTAILRGITTNVTSIHPLFGKRTPEENRHAIVTHQCGLSREEGFLALFKAKCKTVHFMTPEKHDQIMAKTHLAAVLAAQQMKVYVDRAKDIPDEFVPNSFRLLRNFVKTLEDMPPGTIESILANPY